MHIYALSIVFSLLACRDFAPEFEPIQADQNPGGRKPWPSPPGSTPVWRPDGRKRRSARRRWPTTESSSAAPASTWSGRSRPPARRGTSSTTRTRVSEQPSSTALLDSPAYAARTALLWRQLLLPETDDQGGISPAGLEAWLRKKIDEGAGYDQIVREVLAARLGRGQNEMMAAAAVEPSPGGVLCGPGREAGGHRRRCGPGLPRHPRAMRPVPQPPVREVEAGGILGLRRLLRRRPAAGG